MARTTHADPTTSTPSPVLFFALELSKATWKLGFATSAQRRARIRDVPARDLGALFAEVEAAKARLGCAPDAALRSCYEAGRDGFWIHRALEARGVENVILEPASIEVSRRARNAKTDRLDVEKLVRLLVRYHAGEPTIRVVRTPTVEAEDERLLPRQLKRLKKKRAQVTNAIRAALFRHGLDLDPRKPGFRRELRAARQWDGSRLPPGLRQEVDLLWKQLLLLDRQVKDLSQQQREALREVRRGTREGTLAQRKAARLSELKGVGDIGAYVLSTEFFAWREFRNRGEVGALAGLTGTPFSSGSEARDQGISKAGNPRVRTIMVELAWCWLRFQPGSKTSRWFRDHVGKGGSRGKRKAIVAVARKLLVELWHWVEHGVVPVGALLKDDCTPALAGGAA